MSSVDLTPLRNGEARGRLAEFSRGAHVRRVHGVRALADMRRWRLPQCHSVSQLLCVRSTAAGSPTPVRRLLAAGRRGRPDLDRSREKNLAT